MSFVKKIWKDRISQFPNRRTINDGHTVKRVTVGRDEGVVTEEGTPFDATEMNDLENRIFAAIEQGGGGGGGGSSGTYDYSELFNKPRVNNVELNGNKSTADLHINYDDLENKPDIPENATELPISSSDPTNTKEYIDTGLSGKADSSNLSNVATSGNYFDLLNIPLKDLYSSPNKSTSSSPTVTFTIDFSTRPYTNGYVFLIGDGNGGTRCAILSIHNKSLGGVTNLGSSAISNVTLNGSTLSVDSSAWGSLQALSCYPIS